MKISVLTDNHCGPTTCAEHGLSYLVEYDGKRLLFDTGQSDMFLRNAEIMGLRMDRIDMIILSHGHYDHGNGLNFISGYDLLCHPGCFVRRYRRKDGSYIGLKNSKAELSQKHNIITSLGPYKISEKVIFLGEIPRLTVFESGKTSFVCEDGTPDFVKDDSALVLILQEGLFIITGCGHSGVVNTVEHAKKITGIGTVYGIMGGFHLKENDYQTKETIRYLCEIGVTHVLPAHCTESSALSAFYEAFNIRQVYSGEIIEF